MSVAPDETKALLSNTTEAEPNLVPISWALPSVELGKTNAHIAFVFPVKNPKETEEKRTAYWDRDVQKWIESHETLLKFPDIFAQQLSDREKLLKHAKYLFNMEHLTPDDKQMIETKFSNVKTFKEYSEAFRDMFLVILQGERRGLSISTELSIDEDQVLVGVALPNTRGAVQEVDSTEQDEEGAQGLKSTSTSLAAESLRQRAGEAARRGLSVADIMAARFKVQMPLTRQAYRKAKEKSLANLTNVEKDFYEKLKELPVIPLLTADSKEDDNVFYPAYHEHDLLSLHAETNEDGTVFSPFEPFQSTDLIRISWLMVSRSFNIDEMLHQGMIEDVFPVHSHQESQELLRVYGRFTPQLSCDQHSDWMSKLFLNMLPSHGKDEKLDDQLKNYMGVEFGFAFYFITNYTTGMKIPLFGGLLMVLRHVVFQNPLYRRIVNNLFAAVMILWSVQFVQGYIFGERSRIIRWGAMPKHQSSILAADLPTYNKKDDDPREWGWRRVQCWKQLGSQTGLVLMVGIVWSIWKLEHFRKAMRTDPHSVEWINPPISMMEASIGMGQDSNANTADLIKGYGNTVASILITVQIRLLDKFWTFLATWINNKENHRKPQEANDALILKLFTVKLFNLMFPYLYIAFLKEEIEGPCPGDSGGACDDELRSSLIIFFISNISLDLVFSFLSWLSMVYKVKQELKNVVNKKSSMTYLQLQAKQDKPPETSEVLLPFVVQFVFVASFTIVVPIMPILAFFANLLTGKLVLNNMLRLCRRNRPEVTQGIGQWTTILKQCTYFACIVNVGIAVFAQMPLKSMFAHEPEKQLAVFIFAEHGFLLLVSFMYGAFEDVPREAVRFEENNEEIKKLIVDSVERGAPEPKLTGLPKSSKVELREISPDAAMSVNSGRP